MEGGEGAPPFSSWKLVAQRVRRHLAALARLRGCPAPAPPRLTLHPDHELAVSKCYIISTPGRDFEFLFAVAGFLFFFSLSVFSSSF